MGASFAGGGHAGRGGFSSSNPVGGAAFGSVYGNQITCGSGSTGGGIGGGVVSLTSTPILTLSFSGTDPAHVV